MGRLAVYKFAYFLSILFTIFILGLSIFAYFSGKINPVPLYINGEKAERLEGRVKQFYNYTHKRKDKMYMQETLVFPMRQIGDVQNGFRGKLRNINCTQ